MFVELVNLRQTVAEDVALQPGESKQFSFDVQLPENEGSYPLISTVSYRAEGKRLSFKDVGVFHYGIRRTFSPGCFSSDIGLAGRRTVGLSCRPGAKLHVIAPDEIQFSVERRGGAPRLLHLQESVSPLTLHTPIFFVETRVDSSGHQALAVQKRWLTVSPRYDTGVGLPFGFLFIAIMAGVGIALIFWTRAERLGGVWVCSVRWAWSVAVVSVGLVVIQGGAIVSTLFFRYLGRDSLPEHWGFDIPWWVLSTVVQYFSFEGENHAYFRHYLCLPIFLYMVLLNFFALRFFIRPAPATDKYWHGMKSVIASLDRRAKSFSRSLAKTAMRTLLVKFFFAPLLISWSIQNGTYALQLLQQSDVSILSVYAVLLHLLISLDVAIFAFGYLTELPQLNNTVRSVESTVLGWLVCLVCYPPLNGFFFLPFDHPLIDHAWSAPEFVQYLALIPILLLWSIYVWSSLALGFKASNLTNRGIVTRGPYRFVRHPAYAAKVLIWIIEAVVLGKYYLSLCCTFIIVYFLRAWTEERHLRQDPEYLAYQSQVPNRFWPRLW
ncbi:isoprenylcysteine carboxylmethyltransferase family protein [bacterium]|nr:isoprenylcysteine carboxylmethyltransferase family protein [bacterium]